MKADTFAKLVVLEALIEAEIGHFLERGGASRERFREGMVARISDLIDEIDVLDSLAAGRVYDAVVDFLAEMPDDPEGVVESAIRFRRAVDRIVERGSDRRDLAAAATWAVVLDELLGELADEYHAAMVEDDPSTTREYGRVVALLFRCRHASERMLWIADESGGEIASDLDRLSFAVMHRRIPATSVDFLVRSLQRRTAQYRPSTLTRVGSFVLSQVLRRDPGRKKRSAERGRPKPRKTDDRRRGG